MRHASASMNETPSSALAGVPVLGTIVPVMGARGASTDPGSALFGKARAVLGLLCTRPDEASATVAEAQLARTINHTLLTPREFARRRRERGSVVARVPTGPTIPILGSLDGA
jgi:hypothetical protein